MPVITTPAEVFRTPRRHEGRIAAGAADRSYRAYELLYASFVLLPVIAGLGKLMQLFANWESYLAPVFGLGAMAPTFMKGLGIFEIALGAFVAVVPRWGGRAAAAWLAIGAINLLLIPGNYGVVLCALTLAVGAWAMSFLAEEFAQKP